MTNPVARVAALAGGIIFLGCSSQPGAPGAMPSPGSGGQPAGSGGSGPPAGSGGASPDAPSSSDDAGVDVVAVGTGGAGGSGGTQNPGSGGAGGAAGRPGDAGTTDAPGPGPFTVPTITWPSAACLARADDLIGRMTKTEKAAQMVMALDPTNADVQTFAPGAAFAGGSSIPAGGFSAASWNTTIDGYVQAAARTRLAIPILYGVDAVHGNDKVLGATIFPHNAGLGCTRDPALVEEIGRITALEAAATGMTWTYAPVVSVSWDDRWGRVYESFSEDPLLTGQLAAAATLGLQGRMGLGSGKPGIVACAKHFAGDGQATANMSSKPNGIVDRGNILVDEATLRKFGIAPYLPSIQAGLGSIMVSDARWMSASLTSHRRVMTDILKGELGFKGFIATDWNAATDSGGGIVVSVNAGVDMLMHPMDWKGAITTIAAGVADARVNDAVRRILSVKCEAGLFDWKRDPAQVATLGSAEHRAVARRAVRQSLVLLQNNNQALPIAKTSKVWVGGSGASSLTNQCGGWTITWQGTGSDTQGTTIAQAIGKVTAPVGTMAAADTVVVVLSEGPYAEFRGDRASIDTLPPADFALLSQARAAGKKVVAIVVSGRPVLITNQLPTADAWIAAWLPGTEGDGVADVLFGDYPPTGKLSHSWPRADNQPNISAAGYSPLFPLGHGLAY